MKPIDDFGYYVTPSLLNEKPEICILHIGSNDINFKSLQSNNIKQRAEQLMEIGKKCIASGVEHVIISSVLLKRNNKLTNAISEFNTMIRDMCSENGFHFIGHENVLTEHLDRDGIHLNENGIHVFASNLVNFLNNFINTGNC